MDLPSLRIHWYVQCCVPFWELWGKQQKKAHFQSQSGWIYLGPIPKLRLCQKMQINSYVGAIGPKVKAQRSNFTANDPKLESETSKQVKK